MESRPRYDLATFAKALQEERAVITKRREKAKVFPAPPSEGNDASGDAAASDLVGVSLSGGGLRSAMFGLGLLQAFSHRGLLRYVDYLSSVSGGGFASGWLAGQASRAAEGAAPGSEPACFHDDAQSAELTVDHATQRHRMHGQTGYPFRFAGRYVSDTVTWAARHVALTIPVFLLFLGGFGVVATTLAIFWRTWDSWQSRAILSLGNYQLFGNELLYAFLPSIWLIALSLTAYLVWSFTAAVAGWLGKTAAESRFARINRGISKALRIAICLAVLSLSVSFVVFLGNSEATIRDQTKEWSLNTYQYLSIGAALVVQVLAFFGMDTLIKSDRRDAPVWQQMLSRSFATIWPAALFLCFVHLMSRENVSDYAFRRTPDILVDDVEDWPSFVAFFTGKQFSDEIGSPGRTLHHVEIAKLPLSQRVLVDRRRMAELERGVAGTTTEERYYDNPPYFSNNWRYGLGDWLLFFEEPETITVQRRFRTNAKNLLAQQARLDAEENIERIFRAALMSQGTTPKTEKSASAVSTAAAPAVDDARSRVRTLSDFVAKRYGELKYPPHRAEESLKRLATTIVLISQKDVEQAYLRTPDGGAAPSGATDPTSTLPTDPSPRLLTDAELAKLLTRKWRSLDSTVQVPGASERTLLTMRALLEESLPQTIQPLSYQSTLVLREKDQAARVNYLILWASLFGIGAVSLNLNFFSPLFRHYRDGLQRVFTSPARLRRRDRRLPRLSDLGDLPARTGIPFQVFVSALVLRRDMHNCTGIVHLPFVYTGLRCGNPQTSDSPDEASQGLIKTRVYRPKDSVADVISISGSAVAPMTVQTSWLLVIMAMLNLRLGRWVVSPQWRLGWLDWSEYVCGVFGAKRGTAEPSRACHAIAETIEWVLFTPLYIGYELLRQTLVPYSDNRSWNVGFVADGGFREFLGVEELLRRRCRLIIACDGGDNSGKHEFGALADLVRLARSEHGIEFLDLDEDRPVEIDRLRRKLNQDKLAMEPQSFVMLRIRYPENSGEPAAKEGILLFVKMSLTGDEDMDLRQFHKRCPNFPDEPIINQAFSPDQVESYRHLGYHIGRKICRELPPNPTFRDSEAGSSFLPFEELVLRLRLAYLDECHRERTLHSDDIDTAGLFQESRRPKIDWTAVKKLRRRLASDSRAEEGLAAYQDHAEFRLSLRRLIHEQATTGDVFPTKAATSARRFLKCAYAPTGAALAVAVHEFLASPNRKSAAPPQKDADRGSASVFQMGGRGRLTELMDEMQHERLGVGVLLRPKSVTRGSTGALPEGFAGLSNRLQRLGTTVFRRDGEMTALIWLRILLSVQFDPGPVTPGSVFADDRRRDANKALREVWNAWDQSLREKSPERVLLEGSSLWMDLLTQLDKRREVSLLPMPRSASSGYGP